MTLAEELAQKYGFGTQHRAFREAVDEALERAAHECDEMAGDQNACCNSILDEAQRRIRALKSEVPDGQAQETQR